MSDDLTASYLQLVDLNEMEMLRQQRGEGLGQVMRVAQFYRIALAPLRGGGEQY
jgi:hypothetical protein